MGTSIRVLAYKAVNYLMIYSYLSDNYGMDYSKLIKEYIPCQQN